MLKNLNLENLKDSLPITKEVLRYCKLSKNKFHTPGHKGKDLNLEELYKLNFDITEVADCDNLLSPNGVICKSMKACSKILGAENLLFSTSGSTTAILASMHSLKGLGKVAILRSSHNSLYNGLELFQIEEKIIDNIDQFGNVLPLNIEMIEESLKDENVCCVYLTYPDYTGNFFNLKEISKKIKESGKLLYIDSAHGAHFAFSDKLPDCGTKYADVCVMSAHKTLSTLTGGAVICFKDSLKHKIEKSMRLIHTTSPSYPIMMSIEYGIFDLDRRREELDDFINFLIETRAFLTKNGVFLKESEATRLCVDCEKIGISGLETAKFLEEEGIFAEYSSINEVVFIITLSNTKEEIEKLSKQLIRCLKKCPYIEKKSFVFPKGEKSLSYFEAVEKQAELIDKNKAVGRISAKNFGIYPPCMPICVAGDKITQEIVNFLDNNLSFYNIEKNKIWVIK